MTASDRSLIADFLIDGLTTDGAHHKQYYLQMALELLVGVDEVEYIRKNLKEWEDGIAP